MTQIVQLLSPTGSRFIEVGTPLPIRVQVMVMDPRPLCVRLAPTTFSAQVYHYVGGFTYELQRGED